MKISYNDHDRYITILEFNKLTSGNFAARLKQGILVSKSEIPNFVKQTDIDNKLKEVT